MSDELLAGPKLHDVEVRRSRSAASARIEPVPPEEFGIARNARSLRDCDYCFHPSYLHALYPSAPAGAPRLFTIEGATLTLAPRDDSPLTFDYFQKVPALSNANPANWLIGAYPDLYLFGSLAEAHGFVKDADSLSLWAARRNELIDEIERLDTKTRGPAGIRVVGATP